MRAPAGALPDYGVGWTVKYTTELTEDSWFYLRGEEYSAQIDAFFAAVAAGENAARENGFASATETDRTMAMILGAAERDDAPRVAAAAPRRRSWFARKET